MTRFFVALALFSVLTFGAGLPPAAEEAPQRLSSSPRHGEWVDIKDGSDTFRAWVVYPERNTKAPVILVIHEIFGLSDWVRAVADQFAADGFIAIAPDFLSGHGTDKKTPADPQAAVQVIREVQREEVMRRLSAAGKYGAALPASNGKFGSVGYCWGGANSFFFAGSDPKVAASVVFYGTTPDAETLAKVKVPVFGNYGGDDARVNATIPAAETALPNLFSKAVYEKAGHGFLRQQAAREGANKTASEKAWPATISFFKHHLDSK